MPIGVTFEHPYGLPTTNPDLLSAVSPNLSNLINRNIYIMVFHLNHCFPNFLDLGPRNSASNLSIH